MAAPPSLAALVTDWQPHLSVDALLAVMATLYGWAMRHVARRHPARPWPKPRAGSFFAGLATIAVAVDSSIGHYGTTFFWVHMIQHLLLIMVAPALLIHGRPWILALHATRNPWHRRIRRALRSRAVSVISCPLVAVPVYAAVVVGTHLTAFNNVVITNRLAETGELTAYVLAGYLYLLSGFGDEPIRWRLSPPAKMVIILLSMPVDTFTGIALLMTNAPRWPAYAAVYPGWGPDPVTDLQWSGAMMWVGGDSLMIALIVVALIPWLRGRSPGAGRMRWIEKARRARFEQYLPAGTTKGSGLASVDDDDAVLDAYNAWLARVSASDRR